MVKVVWFIWVILDFYLTTFLGVSNFGNTSAMRVVFFLKKIKT